MLTPQAAARLLRRYDLGIDDVSPTALAQRVAVVTGGGRGVGRMLAQALAGTGAAVGVVARSSEELDQTVSLIESAGGIARSQTADVTDGPALAAAFARLGADLGPVDLLVNNAGVLGPIGPLWENDADEWWRTMEINLGGMLAAARLVLPAMVARRRGRIINIASQAGVHRWPLVSAYSVSKAAGVKFTENLARETNRFGVSVFSVHPGLLPIGLGESLPEGTDESFAGQIRNWALREFDAGRGADPAAAMRLVVRLARGDADALTGRHLSVHDDLDAMLAQIDVVREHDLYVLRPERLELGRTA